MEFLSGLINGALYLFIGPERDLVAATGMADFPVIDDSGGGAPMF